MVLKNNILAVLAILMLVIFSGCHIEKRVHRPGYYTEWAVSKVRPKQKIGIEEAHSTLSPDTHNKVTRKIPSEKEETKNKCSEEVTTEIKEKEESPNPDDFAMASNDTYIPEQILENRYLDWQFMENMEQETKSNHANFKAKSFATTLTSYIGLYLVLGLFMLIGGIAVLSIPTSGISVGGLLLVVGGAAFIIAAFLML